MFETGHASMGILAALIIGAIAGWLAGLIVRGAGFGLIGNIVVGIIGALVAGWVLPQLRHRARVRHARLDPRRHGRRGHRARHSLADQARLIDIPIPDSDRRAGGRFLFDQRRSLALKNKQQGNIFNEIYRHQGLRRHR